MHPARTRDPTHRQTNATTATRLLVQLGLLAAVPLALWALANPATATLTVATVAALVWHRRVARARTRPRPTRPPD